jgi:beta-galactosidase GanA
MIMRRFTKSMLCACPLVMSLSFLSLLAQIKNGNVTLDLPRLVKQGTAVQLRIHDKPFLMIAGELGNSSASSLEYMRPIWPKLEKMHLNTALVPVYWELLEPAEGQFDFSLVDGAIESARKHSLKLVLLWFGSWKNSMSCYAPYWVKADWQRFPRARNKDGQAMEILTPFSQENRNADVRAFAALMQHLRRTDAMEQTVVMVQVENEIGMIPDARDHSQKANEAFTGLVPAELMTYLQKNKNDLAPELSEIWQRNGYKTSGTWEDVFGEGLHTEEIFMAWYFAGFTNRIAEAGKREYPLPMYANAALIRPGYQPGQYPSAGPLPHLIDIWRAAAPAVDFIAPDIYFKNFAEWCAKYDRSGNPLFIPEAQNSQSLANAFYAVARHNAMGYAPFSIESLDADRMQHVTGAYDVLRQLTPLILEHQGRGTMGGVLLDDPNEKSQLQLGDFVFNVAHEYSWRYAVRSEGEPPRFGGLIIMLSRDEFIIAGIGLIVTFAPRTGDAVAGIARLDEGVFIDGKWVAGRRMNGDQSHQGRHLHLPGNAFGIQKARLYLYK